MHIQPKLRKGSRIKVSGAFEPKLEAAVQKEMKKFGCSRSFLITEAVAYLLGVKLDYSYKE